MMIAGGATAKLSSLVSDPSISTSASLTIASPMVSTCHAELRIENGELWVRDLGSTNGTFVNEKQVTEAQLKLDSRVRIGETTFRYEE